MSVSSLRCQAGSHLGSALKGTLKGTAKGQGAGHSRWLHGLELPVTMARAAASSRNSCVPLHGRPMAALAALKHLASAGRAAQLLRPDFEDVVVLCICRPHLFQLLLIVLCRGQEAL